MNLAQFLENCNRLKLNDFLENQEIGIKKVGSPKIDVRSHNVIENKW